MNSSVSWLGYLFGIISSLFGLLMWTGVSCYSIVGFSVMALKRAQSLLLKFLFMVRVRGIFSSLGLYPCRSKNVHFPLLLQGFWSISMRSPRVLSETNPEPCAWQEEVSYSLRLVNSKESLGKLPWIASLEAKFI